MAVNHVDYGVLSNLQDVMEGEYPTLIDTFLTDSEQRLGQLHHALTEQASSLDELAMTAHSFKGSSGNMGAVRLSQLCGQLEGLCGHASEPLPYEASPDVQEWVQKIESEFATVRRLFDIERQRFYQ